MNTNKPKARAARRKAAASMGAATLLFAAVGLAAVLVLAGMAINRFFDKTDEIEKHEKLIRPVVMMDPVPFTKVENISEDLLLQSALWATLLKEDSANFSLDEMGMLLVPSSDVDVAAAELFGPSVRVVHRSFDDMDASYLFDPEISAYRVPVVGKVAYSPSVRGITKTDFGLTLRVGYIAPGNVWSGLTKKTGKNQPVPDKYMFYDLQKWEGGYFIFAIRDIDVNAPPRS